MTIARARVIQFEVTSLLLELPIHLSESWLLLKSETLCVIRYNAQATKARAEEEGTCDNSLLSPELPARAQNLRPSELSASDNPDEPGHANSLVSPEPAQNLA